MARRPVADQRRPIHLVKGMQSGQPARPCRRAILLGVIRVETLAARAGGVAGADLVLVEWTAEIGDHWIAPLHVHRSDDEAWYVLEVAPFGRAAAYEEHRADRDDGDGYHDQRCPENGHVLRS